MMIKNKTGTLYIVATPIGNLQDMTLRAIETLKKVDRIAAEDTRHAGTLLNHFSIHKPTISLHDFNEDKRIQTIKDLLLEGESIALISDAGTPLIHDPGFHLVRELKNNELPVVPIPGACAAITALSAAGLPTDKFIFEGFLPHKKEACQKRLKFLLAETRTIIFYVAPHRIMETLVMMIKVFGPERKAVMARELTKMFETIDLSYLGALHENLEQHPKKQRGEIVLLVHGALQPPEKIELDPHDILTTLLKELSPKQAAALTSKLTGKGKNELYKLAISLKSE